MWWVWDVIASIPYVAIVILFVLKRFDVAIGAIVVAAAVELFKKATLPYLADHTWLQRPHSPKEPGFPSGHAAVMSFIVVSLILSKRRNIIIWILGVTIIVLVDVSRIKKKCHTVTQVIVGTMLGLIVSVGWQGMKGQT